MKIGYLGAGAWGFCLANLLAEKGYEVTLWTENPSLLKRRKEHPKFQNHRAEENLVLTMDLNEAIENAHLIIESVTSGGLRSVLDQVKQLKEILAPLVLTSKGIERGTGFLMPDIALDVLGTSFRDKVGCLSGPSLADEVMNKLPTSVVASAYNPELTKQICKVFSTPFFRVYPSEDIQGTSLGGAMKNIIAIACAISDGLGYGQNTKAALMTQGLQEMKKLAKKMGYDPDTLIGLSGLGDLCATCLSTHSRNYIFGQLLAQGDLPEKAQEKIGMIVEGSYTCASALELSAKVGIEMPITETVYSIIYEKITPKEAIENLLSRSVKRELL